MRVAAVYILFADNNGAESDQCSQYIDQHIDRDSQRVDPQEHPRTDLEHQAVFEAVQLGIASRVKRREKSVTYFRVVTPAPTRTSTGLDEHAEKLFDSITSKMSLKARSIHCWRKHVTTGR
jgi:hypothetical protein